MVEAEERHPYHIIMSGIILYTEVSPVPITGVKQAKHNDPGSVCFACFLLFCRASIAITAAQPPGAEGCL